MDTGIRQGGRETVSKLFERAIMESAKPREVYTANEALDHILELLRGGYIAAYDDHGYMIMWKKEGGAIMVADSEDGGDKKESIEEIRAWLATWFTGEEGGDPDQPGEDPMTIRPAMPEEYDDFIQFLAGV